MAGTNDETGRIEAHAGGATRTLALPDRFHWLDFLRFLAALAVVTHHYYFFYMQGAARSMDEKAMIALFPFPQMTFFYDYGQYAVQFFWVLSGFVFAHTYFRKPSDGVTYAAARFARLYPLHFATLIAITAIQLTSHALTGSDQVTGDNDMTRFVIQLFLGSGWGLVDGYGFNVPTWSVSAEIAAYVLFFAFHRSAWFRTAAGQTAAMLSAILVSLSFDAAVPVCAAFFFAGCLVHTLIDKRQVADFVLIVPLTLLALKFPATLSLHGVPMAKLLVAFSIVVFVVALLDVFRLPGGRIAGHLGDITYASYLLHFPMIVATLTVLGIAGVTDRQMFSSPVVFAVYMLSVLAASWLCYHRFERPADRAIRAWARRRHAATAEAATAARTA